jgi:hypothetical protein
MRASFLVFAPLVALSFATAASAHPQGPRAFCSAYPDAPACGGQLPRCAQCHSQPPTLNTYGFSVAEQLWADDSYDHSIGQFEALLPSALAAVEAEDADGDGMSNLEEIALGTAPGDDRSTFTALQPPRGDNGFYKLGAWDAAFAFRRVSNLYCGHPPRYDQMQALSDDDEEARSQVLALLDACLASAYWRGEGLHRLADKRIRPLQAIGFNGIIPLADYEWDYRLFAHVLTDDRDARDLLLADYHVTESGEIVTDVIPAPPSNPFQTGGQPVEAARRAGMITTQWFLMVHTMFSELPRTTAAQAYRAYLGQDIALSEGIDPVEGEPRDVDAKGVQEEACARCHSTIDPLSYAFASYNGIGRLGNLYDFEDTGAYDPTRTPWGEDSVLLGEQVPTLTDWAERAANSDMFKRNLATIFWEHAFGRGPLPREQETFQALWRAVDSDAYSANRLIARIVESDAFGAP